MPTAAFATLGCKVNQYETQRILDSFEERGFHIAEFNAPADIYLLNSCSVTQTAERKSRQMLRRLARQNPGAVVVMTGCAGEMARMRGEELPEAALLVPNSEKLDALSHVLRAFPSLAPSAHRIGLPAKTMRTRATLKVQDGCNVFCSFCSIPYTRRTLVSRPPGELLEEVARLADRGCREVVVTGVLVGWYGSDFGAEGPDLAGLLERLCRVPGIERIRLSSIEPTQVTDRLLAVFRSESKLCNHLHIPMQSGDTGVLRAMNRPYTRDDYLHLCERAYGALPGLAITTDIMAGFPGEDRQAFEKTVDVARQVGFARAHIFRYSPRPGTPAASMPDAVPDAEKETRSQELAAVCRETQEAFIAARLGTIQEILVEGKENEGGLLSGYTENYIRAQFVGSRSLIGTVARVRLMEPVAGGALGEALSAFQPEADMIPLTLVSGTLPKPSRVVNRSGQPPARRRRG